METWTITPEEGVASTAMTQDGKFEVEFEKNETEQDRHYEIKYIDDDNNSWTTGYTVPEGEECRPQTDCREHWRVESIYTPERRNENQISLTRGKGGIEFIIYHDGERVDNLTQNDFTITFSKEGASLNQIIKPSQQANYILSLDTNACAYRGEDIDVIISIKDKQGEFQGCEDIGRLCFVYGEKIRWNIEFENFQTAPNDIRFIGFSTGDCTSEQIYEVGGGDARSLGYVELYRDVYVDRTSWNPATEHYRFGDENIPSGVIVVSSLSGTGQSDNPRNAYVVKVGNESINQYLKIKYDPE